MIHLREIKLQKTPIFSLMDWNPYCGFLKLSMKKYPIFRNLCPRMLVFRIPFLGDFGNSHDIHMPYAYRSDPTGVLRKRASPPKLLKGSRMRLQTLQSHRYLQDLPMSSKLKPSWLLATLLLQNLVHCSEMFPCQSLSIKGGIVQAVRPC